MMFHQDVRLHYLLVPDASGEGNVLNHPSDEFFSYFPYSFPQISQLPGPRGNSWKAGWQGRISRLSLAKMVRCSFKYIKLKQVRLNNCKYCVSSHTQNNADADILDDNKGIWTGITLVGSFPLRIFYDFCDTKKIHVPEGTKDWIISEELCNQMGFFFLSWQILVLSFCKFMKLLFISKLKKK